MADCRHQLRLPAIVTAPAGQTQQPCNNHLPTTMAVTETQQDFDELYEFPLPASPMVSFADTDGKNQFHGLRDAPKAPPASSPTKRNQLPKAAKAGAAACFEERFGDLSMPIRWRLVGACKTAMQELVDDVKKEMAGCSNADLMLPEDVCLWREVVAVAEAVGLDVEELKRKLATASRLLSPG